MLAPCCFGPEKLEELGTALGLAWTFIQRTEEAVRADASDDRELLARHILFDARCGKCRKVVLANSAIRRFREGRSPAGQRGRK
jgi:hypothetical protein